MSRDDLVTTNEKIVADVTAKVVAASPDAIIVVVSNPLDAMCHVARNVSGWPRERVLGMAGILDTARFSTFIAWETGSSVKDVQTLVLGGHGDQMVPLVSATRVGGVPLRELVAADRIEEMIERTAKGGGEIVNLLGTSAWYAPGAAAAQIVDSIVLDEKRVLPCAAYLEGEYGIDGLYVGVPVKLGAGGCRGDRRARARRLRARRARRIRRGGARGRRRAHHRLTRTACRGLQWSCGSGCVAALSSPSLPAPLLTPTVALTVGAILLVAVVTLELVSSRDYIFLPDKAHPVAPLVKVAGGHDPTGAGGIYFVDVIVRKATLLEQMLRRAPLGRRPLPRRRGRPAGRSRARRTSR